MWRKCQANLVTTFGSNLKRLEGAKAEEGRGLTPASWLHRSRELRSNQPAAGTRRAAAGAGAAGRARRGVRRHGVFHVLLPALRAADAHPRDLHARADDPCAAARQPMKQSSWHCIQPSTLRPSPGRCTTLPCWHPPSAWPRHAAARRTPVLPQTLPGCHRRTTTSSAPGRR